VFAQPDRNQVLAFAGIFQSAMLVHQLANNDACDQEALRCSALSILRLEAESVVDVFSSVECLRLGCGVIDRVFGGKMGQASKDIFQYSVAMHQLAVKLQYAPNISELIHLRAQELSQQFDCDSQVPLDEVSETTLYEELAALYSRSISTMEPRIMVHGSQGKLSNPLTVNKVRSALFAGIRAAFLWHQLGGRRWQLMLHRRSIQAIARRLA
jgi:high frequency lysogenization protein